MSTDNMSLMSAMLTKMNWMEERQKVLAQNIANADTPDYQPMDVKPLDFKNLLKSSTSTVSLSAPGVATPGLATTDAKHIVGSGSSETAGNTPTEKEKFPYEVAPAGNAVILEEQLIKMNQNYADYQFTTNLYEKNIQMLKSAAK